MKEIITNPVGLLRYFLTPEDSDPILPGVSGEVSVRSTLKAFFHVGLAMVISMALSTLN